MLLGKTLNRNLLQDNENFLAVSKKPCASSASMITPKRKFGQIYGGRCNLSKRISCARIHHLVTYDLNQQISNVELQPKVGCGDILILLQFCGQQQAKKRSVGSEGPNTLNVASAGFVAVHPVIVYVLRWCTATNCVTSSEA